MLITRLILAPRSGTITMIKRRIPEPARKELEGKTFDAVGLIQCDLPSLFYGADLGQKASNVIAAELTGNCPQHINTVAFFGDTEAVKSALEAIELEEAKRKK